MPFEFPSTVLNGSVALVVSRADGEHASEVVAAQGAGSLILEIEWLHNDDGPWEDRNLPGTSDGCGHWPDAGRRRVRIRSDRNGIYFAAIADLILRSNRIETLALTGELPSPFVAAAQAFAARRGYRLCRPGATGPRLDQTAFAAVPVLSLAERVAPRHAALLLIDVQNDFCAPDGATGRLNQSMTMIDVAVGRMKALLAAARDAGLFIVHVRSVYGELFRHVGSPYRFPAHGGREPAVWTASAADDSGRNAARPSGPSEVCLADSWGGQFVDGMEPRPYEAIVTKHRFSAFRDTGLNDLLRARGVRSVIVAGVTTNCCVESTAREATMRDFHLVVVSDCVAVKDHLRDLHDATLESLGLYFGLVRPSTDIMAAWAESRTASGRR